MEIVIACAHIVGSYVALGVLRLASEVIGSWESERNKKHALEELSIKLGVTVEVLDDEALVPKILKHSSERYSSELLRNRISDFCGAIRTLWWWIATLVQVIVFLGVVWFTITESLETAIYAWSIVAIGIFFWIVSTLFGLACRLLTGRFPDEARLSRKATAAFLKRSKIAIS